MNSEDIMKMINENKEELSKLNERNVIDYVKGEVNYCFDKLDTTAIDQEDIVAFHSTVAMEECGELIQAISKCYRDEITGSYKDRNTHLFNLTEECADVILNIFRLCILYGVDEEFLMKVLAVKVERYRNYVKECTIKNKI